MIIDLYKKIYTMKQPELGEKITQLRKQKGLTQEELIDKCNLSVRTIQRIEAGEVTPRSYTLKAILNALDYDFSKIQDYDFQSKSTENTLADFKSNWFQEPKEKHYVVIMLFLILSFSFSIGFTTTLEIPYLYILVIGLHILFTFNYFAGYHEGSRKNVIEKQLENKEIIMVKLSSLKLLGFLIFYFAIITFYLLPIYSLFDKNFFYSNWLSMLTSIGLIFSFSYYVYKTIKKVFTRKFELIIDENGVTDYASELAVGFIPWSDIKNVEVRSFLLNQKSIKLILENPEVYINRYEPKSFKRRLGEASYNRFDSPIQLKTTYLNIRPSQLYHILNFKIKEYIDKD